jgi:hypothetical protein
VNEDSGFTVYYYKGEIPFPDTTEATNTTFTNDSYSRLAVYANWYALPKKLNLLAGWLHGEESLGDASVNGLVTGVNGGAATAVKGSNVGNSGGYFVEADYHVIKGTLALGVRYDIFDPSKKVAHNSQRAMSIFANYHVLDNAQVIADYKHQTTEAGATPGDNKDNQVLARFIFIF